MTIREYADIHNFEIVGRLHRILPLKKIRNISVYQDDAGNEYWVNRLTKSIMIFSRGDVI